MTHPGCTPIGGSKASQEVLGIRKVRGVISAGIFPQDNNDINEIFEDVPGRGLHGRGAQYQMRGQGPK
jgi:hypothetical protein